MRERETRSRTSEGGVFEREEVKQGREPRQGSGWKRWWLDEGRSGRKEREGARGDL